MAVKAQILHGNARRSPGRRQTSQQGFGVQAGTPGNENTCTAPQAQLRLLPSGVMPNTPARGSPQLHHVCQNLSWLRSHVHRGKRSLWVKLGLPQAGSREAGAHLRQGGCPVALPHPSPPTPHCYLSARQRLLWVATLPNRGAGGTGPSRQSELPSGSRLWAGENRKGCFGFRFSVAPSHPP